jgi:hypothetical protein
MSAPNPLPPVNKVVATAICPRFVSMFGVAEDIADQIFNRITDAGYVIVPVEPTQAMLSDAAWWMSREGSNTGIARDVWDAMVAASRFPIKEDKPVDPS